MTRILSWNVNGIRAAIKNGLWDFTAKEKPDILCLQEVRSRREDAGKIPPEFHVAWNDASKKGYSGTAILSREKPLNLAFGLGSYLSDDEGRVITAEFPEFFVVCVYTPNSQNELRRLDYRTREWDPAFRLYLTELKKQKPVIATGDFNVAHQEIDLANPKTNRHNAGFTDEERKTFSELLDSGFHDSFRLKDNAPHRYSWWSYRAGARQRNVGWRIDYCLTDTALLPSVANAEILSSVMGSDHCPVGVVLKGN